MNPHWVLIVIGAMNAGHGTWDTHVSVVAAGIFESQAACEKWRAGLLPDNSGMTCVREDNKLFRVPYIADELAREKIERGQP